MKEHLRPLYLRLQGYLNQLSKFENKSNQIESSGIWTGYHNTLAELSAITEETYDDFKLTIERGTRGLTNNPNYYQYVKLDNFLFQLAGLIGAIYGKYFFEERNPLDGAPSTIINTTQSQNQSVKIEIAVEITELITSKLSEYKEGTPERTFLEQVRDGLKSGKGVVELINLILSTGTKLGLTTSAILQLLSK